MPRTKKIGLSNKSRGKKSDNEKLDHQLIHGGSSGTHRDSADVEVTKSDSKEHMARARCIVDLSQQILSNVLGMLVDCDRKVYEAEESDIDNSSSTHRALQLSGVCRRFRSILLDMPGAWAVVTPKQPGRAFLTMCAKRSMDKGLRLFFKLDSSASKLVRNLVLDYAVCTVNYISTRVKFHSNLWARGEEDKVVQHMAKLNISTLKTLNISYLEPFKFDSISGANLNANDTQDEDDRGSDNICKLSDRKASYELQSLLRSPTLQSISFVNAIPLAGLMHHITKLSIKLGASRISDLDRWDLRDLTTLLRSQSNLEDFALEFYESRTFKSESEDSDEVDDGLPVELPFLNTLDLYWRTPPGFSAPFLYPDHDITRLFKLLDIKNVKTFRFKLSREDYDEDEDHEEDDGSEYSMPFLLDDLLNFFLSPDEGGRLLLLESFHLQLFSTLPLGFMPRVRLPPSLIQNIKHLSLHINIDLSLCDLDDDDVDVPGTLPHLQTVTLRNCDKFTVETVESIVETIKRGGNWENFQRLLVDECRYLSRGSLKQVVGPGKLEFYPNTREFVYF